MNIIPDWLQTAFVDWLTGRLYVDAAGNYRRRFLGRPRAVIKHNDALRRTYPDSREFQRAAERWLALWEVVPTARLRHTLSRNRS